MQQDTETGTLIDDLITYNDEEPLTSDIASSARGRDVFESIHVSPSVKIKENKTAQGTRTNFHKETGLKKPETAHKNKVFISANIDGSS